MPFLSATASIAAEGSFVSWWRARRRPSRPVRIDQRFTILQRHARITRPGAGGAEPLRTPAEALAIGALQVSSKFFPWARTHSTSAMLCQSVLDFASSCLLDFWIYQRFEAFEQ